MPTRVTVSAEQLTDPAEVQRFNDAQGRLTADHPAAAAAGGLSRPQVERRIS